ncbi:nuclear transport factor 2 family protein [Rhizobium sp. RAF56]|uniref:nuclear transport factor 2 family protein n=1 Tax=Rhizobium sp. RAF56 TaxID=3233062 RepID=UPI003F958FDC
MGFDPVERCRLYFAAIDAIDFAAIEAFYADDVTYSSNGVGSLSGRDEVMAAIRGYFAAYPDQTSITKSIEALTPLSARAVWSVRATHSGTGNPLVREGEETITFDGDGQVVSVDVTDYQPF